MQHHPDLPDFLARLSLDLGADARAIRRAYARQLRLIDQATDLPGFQALREAYETALRWAEHQQRLAQQDNAPDQAEPIAPAEVDAATVSLSKCPPEPAPSDANVPGSAEAVFQQLMARCHHLMSGPEGEALAAWEDAIRAAVAEQALLSLSARHTFEQMIVDFLATGWRPGKEKLLAAAAQVFDWEHDHRRLPQFGAAGRMVQRAIDEREIFLRQPSGDLEIDRHIIERLRSGNEPDPTQLQYDMAVMERLLGRFPHLMALSIEPDAVARWREVFVANGGVLKPLDVADAAHIAPGPSFGFAPWGVGLMLLFTLLRACGSH